MSIEPTVARRVARIALEQPGEAAVTFLPLKEGAEAPYLSYGALWNAAAGLADRMSAAGLAGRPVLLLYEPGLDVVVALFACLAAGAIAVPAPLPTFPAQRARLAAVMRAAQPAALMSTAATLAAVARRLGTGWLPEGLPEILTDVASTPHCATEIRGPLPLRDGAEVALLQFTSGSTGEPRGVAISQSNLAANVAMLADAFAAPPATRCLSWMPHTHDMGLIGGLIAPLATGCRAYLMAPATMLQQPLRWLQAIAQHRIEISGGPNFAYALAEDRIPPAEAVALDLSHWRIAYVGAEPIRPATLDRFATLLAPSGFDPAALLPCYGLAEATVLVAAAPVGSGVTRMRVDRARLAEGEAVPATEQDAAVLAHCGIAAAGTKLTILHPETSDVLPPGRIGEIAVSGPQVALQCWPDGAKAGEIKEICGQQWLRTGDLGFLDENRLVVVDRLKDVLIVNGRNHACHEVEATASGCLVPGALHDLAAILMETEDAPVLVILAEIASPASAADCEENFKRMRGALLRVHGLGLSTLIFLRRGALVRTASGKPQRRTYREMLRAGRLDIVAQLGTPLRIPA